ncbi:DUF3796 domain-containing protein [Clostridium sardiniense]|uniref:DUF3796 domain-containing protein n=1 Tax=Clostridium sardiniense TaxID=29369 RepID=UPI003D342A7C
MKDFTLKPHFALLGLLGFLGLIPIAGEKPTYFAFVFFSFFGWYFFAKLPQKSSDEKFISAKQKSSQIMLATFAILCFSILFFLDRGTVNVDTIVIFGTLSYSAVFILCPALTYHFYKSEPSEELTYNDAHTLDK